MATVLQERESHTRKSVKLGDLLRKRGAKVAPAEAPDLPFVGLESIAPNGMKLLGSVPFGSLRSIGSGFQAGDVLYGRLRPYLNKVWLADRAGVASGEFFVLQCSDELDPDYLAYLIHSRGFVDYASHRVTGDRPRLDYSHLAAFEIILPPLDEQRRIRCRLNELITEVEDGEEELRRARQELDTYRKSLLKAAVTGELTADWRANNPTKETGEQLLRLVLADRLKNWNADLKNQRKQYKEPEPAPMGLPVLPNGWVWASIDQLIYNLRNGTSMKPERTPPGKPILRISAVREMRMNVEDLRWLAPEVDVSDATVRPGELLFTRYNGSPELVGVCGRYRGKEGVAYPDKLMRARVVGAAPALADFLELAANTGATRKFIAANTKTTAGQHGVSGDTVKKAPVPIPPPEEMDRIVELVRDGVAQRQEQLELINEATESSDCLRHSILAAAFGGELTL